MERVRTATAVGIATLTPDSITATGLDAKITGHNQVFGPGVDNISYTIGSVTTNETLTDTA